MPRDYYFEAFQTRLTQQRFQRWVRGRMSELAEEFTATGHAEGWLPPDLHFEYGPNIL